MLSWRACMLWLSGYAGLILDDHPDNYQETEWFVHIDDFEPVRESAIPHHARSIGAPSSHVCLSVLLAVGVAAAGLVGVRLLPGGGSAPAGGQLRRAAALHGGRRDRAEPGVGGQQQGGLLCGRGDADQEHRQPGLLPGCQRHLAEAWREAALGQVPFPRTGGGPARRADEGGAAGCLLSRAS